MLENRVVDVRDLWIGYRIPKRYGLGYDVNVVIKGVSFYVNRAEVYGIVGESGSGKSTLLKAIMGIVEPIRGQIVVQGVDIARNGAKRRDVVKRIGYVSQDPFLAVDPKLRVFDIVSEPMKALKMDRHSIEATVEALLSLVGLPRKVLTMYPHQLSGGMLQRVVIARALAAKPLIVLLDEPTSALDTVTQFQILHLLKELQDTMKYTYILVSHDLKVVGFLANRVAVLLKGYLVEEGSVDKILNEPLHPYTEILVEASGFSEVKELEYSETGCPLYNVCRYRMDICRQKMPSIVEYGDRRVACWHYVGG